MKSRAVHLELATSLESSCFISVLRRFMNRRGPPKCIYSDNGSNFVGAEGELRAAINNWNQKQIHDELLQKGSVNEYSNKRRLCMPVGSGRG